MSQKIAEKSAKKTPKIEPYGLVPISDDQSYPAHMFNKVSYMDRQCQHVLKSKSGCNDYSNLLSTCIPDTDTR